MTIIRSHSPKLRISIPESSSCAMVPAPASHSPRSGPFGASPSPLASRLLHTMLKTGTEAAPPPPPLSGKSVKNSPREMSKARFLRQSPLAQTLGLSDLSPRASPETSYRKFWSNDSPSSTRQSGNQKNVGFFASQTTSGRPARSSPKLVVKRATTRKVASPESSKVALPSTTPKATTDQQQQQKTRHFRTPPGMSRRELIKQHLKSKKSLSMAARSTEKENATTTKSTNATIDKENKPTTKSSNATTTLATVPSRKTKPLRQEKKKVTHLRVDTTSAPLTLRQASTTTTKKSLPDTTARKPPASKKPLCQTLPTTNQLAIPSQTQQQPKSLGKVHRTALGDCTNRQVPSGESQKQIEVPNVAPRLWTHEQLVQWLSGKSRTKRVTLTSHVDGRSIMRMTKVQIAEVVKFPAFASCDNEERTAISDFIYRGLRVEADRIDRLALKQRAAAKKNKSAV